jgi:tRNA 2-thiouridine synthesizing protein A
MAATKVDQELDARGLLCPMPVVKTAKAMKEMAPGEVLKVMATDRGSVTDMPAWTETTGNELLEWHEEGDFFVYLIRKSE